MTKDKFIIYQLFIRVFGNTNENLIPSGSLSLNGTGKFSSINADVLRKLTELNITHIWFTGIIQHATCEDFTSYGIKQNNPLIVKGMAGSPYAITDYYDVNPYLADDPNKRMEEFDNLIKRTHNAGFKVIIDFVPNHLAREYKSDYNNFTDENFYLLNEDFSNLNFISSVPDTQKDLYNSLINKGVIFYNETPAKATGNNCFNPAPYSTDWYETIKLNYNESTWYKMKDILLFWLKKGVDGFRCDMAEMVSVEFWEWVIKEIKYEYPNATFIAEIYSRDKYREFIFKGGFDYLYDKDGLYDSLKGISQGQRGAGEITNCWQNVGEIQDKMLNFLENHDEQRIASNFNLGEPQFSIPELTVSLLLNKAPFMLYFGQEYGERGMLQEGFSGLDGRTSIFDWCFAPSMKRALTKSLKSNEREIYNTYKILFDICMKFPAFFAGEMYDLQYAQATNTEYNGYNQYCFARIQKNKTDKLNIQRELFIIAVDFNFNKEEHSHIYLVLPPHFLDFVNIKEGKYKCVWLKNGEESNFFLNNFSDKINIKSAKPISFKKWKYGVSIVRIIY